MSSVTSRTKNTKKSGSRVMGLILADGSTRHLQADEAERVELALREEDYFSPAAAAKILGVSRPMVSKWIRDGKLPDNRVGSHHRISRDAVLDLKKERLAAEEAAVAMLEAAKVRDPVALRSVSLARAAAARAVEAQRH
ncbi:MAG TPA: helix-turn-helix domain-containing protein [Microthrixaceae bacterium]|nr:helix-turn-helix domain-containing protein [Microthrixaceae bacterium]